MNIKKIPQILRAIWMCARFPFLYPRNRWTGLHYNNWKIIDRIKELYNEGYRIGSAEDGFMPVVIDKRAARKYRFLKWWHDTFLQIIHWIPEYNELDWMDDGWRKAFGIQMCKEIKDALLRAGGRKMLMNYRISDMKEKMGHLEWYDFGAPKEVHDIIVKYEYISARTCINCGKPATGMTRGYILPYCDDCCSEEMDRYYTKDMPFYGYISSKLT